MCSSVRLHSRVLRLCLSWLWLARVDVCMMRWFVVFLYVWSFSFLADLHRPCGSLSLSTRTRTPTQANSEPKRLRVILCPRIRCTCTLPFFYVFLLLFLLPLILVACVDARNMFCCVYISVFYSCACVCVCVVTSLSVFFILSLLITFSACV